MLGFLDGDGNGYGNGWVNFGWFGLMLLETDEMTL